MKEYDYYYFDFDGTLMDTYESLINPFKKAFREADVELTDEDVKKYIHMALIQTCEDLHITDENKMRKVYETITIEMEREEEIKKIQIFPEVVKVLSSLKERGKHIAVVSGNGVAHIKRVMSILNLSEYFDFYVGGDSTKLPKPYADPLEKAMELSSFPNKSRCMYIGDSLQDPQCAKNAGIDGILLDRKNEYLDYHDKKVFSLEEIL